MAPLSTAGRRRAFPPHCYIAPTPRPQGDRPLHLNLAPRPRFPRGFRKFTWVQGRPAARPVASAADLVSAIRRRTHPAQGPFLAGFRQGLAVFDRALAAHGRGRALAFLASFLATRPPLASLALVGWDQFRGPLRPFLLPHLHRLRGVVQYLATPRPGALTNFRFMFPRATFPALTLGLRDSSVVLGREALALALPGLALVGSPQDPSFVAYPLVGNAQSLQLQCETWASFLGQVLGHRSRILGRWLGPTVGKWNRTTTSAFSGPRSTVKPSRAPGPRSGGHSRPQR